MVQATRLHFGVVMKELDEGIKDEELWHQAEQLAGGVKSLILVKYLQLRAESMPNYKLFVEIFL